MEELLLNQKCLILLTKGVNEYRKTIPKYVNRKDLVLEIGFAWGNTVQILSKYAKYAVGIDKGESYYKACEIYPKLNLFKFDGFDIKAVLSLGYKFNKIYIDISGCRDIFDVIRIVLLYKSVFNPELIVVKSSRLKRFVSLCRVFNIN